MNILLIDDDPISRLALTDALGPLKHLRLSLAESGEQAWQMLSAGMHPALCCCDVRMPGMTGIELLERMRADSRLRNVRVLLVSSAAERQIVLDAVRYGAAGFIVKPFLAADLRAKLKDLLGANLETLFEQRGVVIKRLGITPTRYTLYLESLAKQMEAAAQKLRSAAALDAATLDALHTGCLTLGAHLCAGMVEGLKNLLGHDFDPASLAALDDCIVMLRERAEGMQPEWR